MAEEMRDVDSYVEWAESQGVCLSGIQLRTIPGRGIGVVATRDIESGEVVLDVPVKAHRGLHSIPKSIAQKLPPDATIHCAVATHLARSNSAIHQWLPVMPPLAQFESTLPFLWPAPLRELLPSVVATRSARHRAAMERDRRAFLFTTGPRDGIMADLEKAFLHAWCIVNTRSFYFETPDMLRYPWEDRLTLLPVADMFNHAGTGCAVQFSPAGHQVITDRTYHKGEELFTSYGQHSNDYLFAEYGFLLDGNPWDMLCLDEVVLPKLTEEQKLELETRESFSEEGLILGAQGLEQESHLYAALQLLCSEVDSPAKDEPSEYDLETLLQELLQEMLEKAKDMLAKVKAAQAGTETQKKMLARRWKEIYNLALRAVEQLRNGI